MVQPAPACLPPTKLNNGAPALCLPSLQPATHKQAQEQAQSPAPPTPPPAATGAATRAAAANMKVGYPPRTAPGAGIIPKWPVLGIVQHSEVSTHPPPANSQPALASCRLPPPLPQFGKRLLGEAARRWTHSYIDYKQLKSAIKRDVAAQGEHRQLLPLLLLVGSWRHWQGGRRLQGFLCHVKLAGS